MAARLILLGFITVLSSAVVGQDVPDEKAKKDEEREAKAKALYDEGVNYMEEGKFKEAKDRLQELRDRYRMSAAYWQNSEDIAGRLLECGSRIAVEVLKTQALYKKTHQDTWHGIEFAPPADWRGIPPFQRYFGRMDTSEVDAAGETIRITRYTSRFLENVHLQVFKVYAPKDFADLETRVLGEHQQRFKGLTEDSATQFRGKFHVASRKTYTDAEGDRLVIYNFFGEKKGYALVGYWRTRAEELFFSFSSSSGDKKREVKAEDWKEALRVFDESAKTFWIWPQQQLSQQRIRLERGVQVSDWKVYRTKNYRVEYATRDDYAKQVGDQMEKIMNLYRTILPSSKEIPVCRIKLFDTEEDFQYYGQAPGAAAYWSPAQEEICAYRFTGKELKLDSDEKMTIAEGRNPEEETFHVMYHEGYHQYMFFYMGRGRNIYVPSWLNEGMGDYFFGGTWVKKGGKVSLELQANWWRLDTIHTAVKENKHVPLERIFRYTQQQYYSDAGLCYAEGWAICYFFLTSEVAKKKGYDRILLKMLHELKTSGNWEKATDVSFRGVDFAAMESEWKEFVLSLKKESPGKPDKGGK